jgi:hypothetical protein
MKDIKATRTQAETRETVKAEPEPTTRSGTAQWQATKLLTDDQIGEIVELRDDVDSIEIKLTIPATAHRTTIRGLDLDPVEAEPSQVFFFDTPRLDANKSGVVVRARRSRGGSADTVIKLRPVVPAALPDSLRRSAACKVELDILPGGFVCSASLKGRCTGEEVTEVVNGETPLSKILSKEQRAFYGQHAPDGVDLDGLAPLGPTYVLKSRSFVKRLDRKFTAEMWLYPDNTRLLELSIKSTPDELFHVVAEFRAFLARREIDTFELQETKTATALEYFSRELRGA